MRTTRWIAMAASALAVLAGSDMSAADPAMGAYSAASAHPGADARTAGVARPPHPPQAPRPPQAPHIASAQWINSPSLTDANLRGHLVLVEFWTFECINCQRTIPAMRALDQAWTPRGVVILGVHRPEFRKERSVANVRAAVKAAGIAYPVCLDNDATLWDAFHTEAWPSFYLLDKSGAIRWRHVGELHQGDEPWRNLQALLRTL